MRPDQSSDPADLTAVQARRLLDAGQLSAAELLEACLRRIEERNGPFDTYEDNGAVNAFVRLDTVGAHAAAADADTRAERGDDRSLLGIPSAVKDNIAIAGLPLSLGVAHLRNHRPGSDAEVVGRLRAAGSPIVGHTQSQAWVDGEETPQTANPWNHDRIAGGSSGGSAAAVASGMVPFALGTETAGSLIYPALACGVVTLKPTLGLVPTDEVFSGEPSLDVVGPLARTAADCSMMLACLIEGSLDLRTEPRRVDRPLEGVTFGFPIDDPMVDETTGIRTSGPQWEAAEPALRAAMERWLDLIGSLGARLVPFEFGPSLLDPHPSVLDSRVPEHVMRAREQARGYRGGLRSIADQLERHDPGAAAEIRAHVATLDAQDDPDPTDADYARATAIVADEQRRVTRAVATAGLNAILILEVGSQAPPRRGADSTSHAVHRDRQTLFNVLGWPIVNLPIGWTPDHMPVSVQLAGTAGSDARLLALATDIQGATGWHDRPPVAPVTPHRRAGDPRS